VGENRCASTVIQQTDMPLNATVATARLDLPPLPEQADHGTA
jgi:hypothetical protein